MRRALRERLVRLADEFETADFLRNDPSRFMHRYRSRRDREAVAFVASALSYGSRAQFLPRIERLLALARRSPSGWIASRRFAADLPAGCPDCFYRLQTVGDLHRFLAALADLLEEHGSLGRYIESCASTGSEAVRALCDFFKPYGVSPLVPKDPASACKRLCLFLRWMVRTGSPVDLGLWTFIDPRTLAMPLDTHVLRQAVGLGLLRSPTPSFSAACRLSAALAEAFPSDPLRGDFALFGLGTQIQL